MNGYVGIALVVLAGVLFGTTVSTRRRVKALDKSVDAHIAVEQTLLNEKRELLEQLEEVSAQLRFSDEMWKKTVEGKDAEIAALKARIAKKKKPALQVVAGTDTEAAKK